MFTRGYSHHIPTIFQSYSHSSHNPLNQRIFLRDVPTKNTRPRPFSLGRTCGAHRSICAMLQVELRGHCVSEKAFVYDTYDYSSWDVDVENALLIMNTLGHIYRMGQPGRFELCYGTSLTGTKGAPVLVVEQQKR